MILFSKKFKLKNFLLKSTPFQNLSTTIQDTPPKPPQFQAVDTNDKSKPQFF